MKIAFHYPSRCLGTPFDPENLWTSSRGLTGSEVSCIQYARGLGKKGHDVTLFTGLIEGMKIRTGDYLKLWDDSHIPYDDPDAVISWMAPVLCGIVPDPEKTFRVYNEQCSDFGNANALAPGWESKVDLFCPLSRSHGRHMSTQTGYPQSLYRVMHNGVDVEEFKPTQKVSGRVIWASSHDRGLHSLLRIWPDVKQAVPWAELHVYYNTSGMQAFAGLSEDPARSDWSNELIRRSAYTLHALNRLQGHGVTLKGSASRQEIQKAFGEAEVLAYPCSPVRYTETFGNTVLEAMSAGCVPVLCMSDAFEELWGKCPGVLPPLNDQNLEAYKQVLIKVLQSDKKREAYASACRQYAHRFYWPVLVDKLEKALLTRGREGLEPVFV